MIQFLARVSGLMLVMIAFILGALQIGIHYPADILAYVGRCSKTWGICLLDARTGASMLHSDEARTESWTHDMTQLVYASISTRDLYLRRYNGETIHLTEGLEETSEFAPRWSPDETQIAYFTKISDTQTDLRLMVIDDLTVTTLITLDSEPPRFYAWSPDGTQIAYFRYTLEYASYALWVVDVRTGENNVIGKSDNDSLQWSPDGQHIAFVPTASKDLTIINTNGDIIQSVSDNNLIPHGTWSTNGDQIAYTSALQGIATSLKVWDIATGTSRTILDDPSFVFSKFIWSSNPNILFAMSYTTAITPYREEGIYRINIKNRTATPLQTDEVQGMLGVVQPAF